MIVLDINIHQIHLYLLIQSKPIYFLFHVGLNVNLYILSLHNTQFLLLSHTYNHQHNLSIYLLYLMCLRYLLYLHYFNYHQHNSSILPLIHIIFHVSSQVGLIYIVDNGSESYIFNVYVWFVSCLIDISVFGIKIYKHVIILFL